MTKDDIRSILTALLEKSKAKQVIWTPFEDMAEDHDDYVVSFPKSSVNIFEDPEEQGIIKVNILNSAGKAVGWLRSDESESVSRLLEELLASARESVFKSDETLEDLKRALAS
ncbi:MAG TPA: hypothetical protein VN937_19870 [Blastocatellia bacterium]|nr:hypothetical protein [Blastocatellia bacterium]